MTRIPIEKRLYQKKTFHPELESLESVRSGTFPPVQHSWEGRRGREGVEGLPEIEFNALQWSKCCFKNMLNLMSRLKSNLTQI